MPFLKRILKKFSRQTMLYWQKTGDGDDGKPVYGDPNNPEPLKVRWEDKVTEVILLDGRPVNSSAYILSSVVVIPGSLVYLGDGKDPLTGWKTQPTWPDLPTNNQGAREVLTCKTTPDLKAQEYLYEVYVT